VCCQVTIAYPDEGAWKRFHYQFKDEGYPEVICTKVRDGAKRIVRLKVSLPLCVSCYRGERGSAMFVMCKKFNNHATCIARSSWFAGLVSCLRQ
jgi:hypothetical protein